MSGTAAKVVPLYVVQEDITEIRREMYAANIKVCVLTSTMIGEDEPNPNARELKAYNAFLFSLASAGGREKVCGDLMPRCNGQLKDAPRTRRTTSPAMAFT